RRRRWVLGLLLDLVARTGGPRGVLCARRNALGKLHQHVPPRLPEHDVSSARQLLREIAEAAGAIGTLRERGIELEQRALEEPELRRDFTIGQDLQRTTDERHGLIERRRLR